MSTTETISPRYVGLDSWDDGTILSAFSEGQEQAVAAVRSARPALAIAARAIAERVGETGRIIYAGAGSSGLIAALDGAELAGTFGWPEERTVFVLAGGTTLAPALHGGNEDDAERGRAEMVLLSPRHADVIIAVTASGSTPFTLSATAAAREAGALTIGLANNPAAPILRAVDVPVFLDSGPEILNGSTRMGAGTAQKAALGFISTLAMIRMGHIYDGLMVDLRVDNQKLRRRAITMLRYIAGCDEAEAVEALDRSGGKVKRAALVLKGVALAEADRLLAVTGGNLRTALAEIR
jgi:N-acetylmuramic acid 6-phosphate etherase